MRSDVTQHSDRTHACEINAASGIHVDRSAFIHQQSAGQPSVDGRAGLQILGDAEPGKVAAGSKTEARTASVRRIARCPAMEGIQAADRGVYASRMCGINSI